MTSFLPTQPPAPPEFHAPPMIVPNPPAAPVNRHWRDIPQLAETIPAQHLEADINFARSLIGRPVEIEMQAPEQFLIENALRVHGQVQLLLRDARGNKSWKFVGNMKSVRTLS